MYALDINDGSILWQSEGLVDESSTESTNFREDGALVVGNNRSVLCIDPEDGSTLWEISRSSPTSNGQEVAIYGNKGYIWEPTPFGPEITAIDLARGERLYSSGALSPGLIQQLAPFVGPDGTVYGPRSMNNPVTDSLYALIDTDTGFVKKWAAPIGYVPFSTGGVGPDGSVYTYGRGANVIRLDAETGEILDSSKMILPGASSSPRMAIDHVGRVYVTNGEFAEGEFYVFDRHLNTLWSTPIRNVNIGGPAIGKNGTLVICGVGTDVRAYRGMPTSTLEVSEEIVLEVSPNPTPDRIYFDLPETTSDVEFWLFDKNGRMIEKKGLDGYTTSHHVDLSHLPKGTYFPIISAGKEKYRTQPVMKL
jgi:outer membrane protein assembly factor BamB